MIRLLLKQFKNKFNRDITEQVKTSSQIKELILLNGNKYIKRFVILNLIGIFSIVYYISDYHKKTSVHLSKVAGVVANLKLPTFLRSPIFNFYMKIYNVNYDEILEKDLKSYKTVNEFFIRKIDMKKRIPDSSAKIVSPCDGRILSVSEVKNGTQILIIKDTPYEIFDFLFGPLRNISLLAPFKNFSNNDEKLIQVTIYLSPGDCHRYFSPCDINVTERVYIPGALFPVKPSYVNKHKKTFIENERVTLKCEQTNNNNKPLFMTYVGALNVGSINLNFEKFNNDDHKKYVDHSEFISISENKIADNSNNQAQVKGVKLKSIEEVGHFRFGSTIVLVFPVSKDDSLSHLVPGNKIEIGNRII
jgi:phosphatidylserine decarboxylase